MTDEEVLDGYVTGRRLPDGRLAAVQERMFNSIVIAGLTPGGYDLGAHW